MAKITGIGGVFIKTKNDKTELAKWYAKNLGVSLEEWGGALMPWTEDKAEDKGLTVWTVADADSDWFNPSTSNFMINYRVDNLGEMIAQLKENGVEIVKGPDYHENGKFAWIMDPDAKTVRNIR